MPELSRSSERLHLSWHGHDGLHKIVQVDLIDWKFTVYPRVDPEKAQPPWACLTEGARIMQLVRISLGNFSALWL